MRVEVNAVAVDETVAGVVPKQRAKRVHLLRIEPLKDGEGRQLRLQGIEGEGSGGYASEMSEEYQKAQAELVSGHIAKQDIVITTALIPGRPAPRLVSDAQVASMRPGSVIVDLAADAGGNVEGTVSGENVEKHSVTIIGASNLARSLAADSSALFARNLYHFLSAFWDKEQGRPVLPDDDEIVKAIRLTRDGKVVSERLTAA
jgi:NAD(P) transhydrogenase subunit alpha